VKQFKSDDISSIQRVAIEPINAAMSTLAGKKEIAKELVSLGLVKRPEQYINILTNGKVEPLYEFESLNLARLRQEKELLQQGIGLAPVDPMTGQPMDDGQQHIRPLITDTHWLDIQTYLEVLSTPDARNNSNVVNAVLGAISEKIRLWRSMDPILLQVLGGPPPAQPMPGMPIQGPVGPSAQKHAEGSPDGQVAPKANVHYVQLPHPPDNPITGEKQPQPMQGSVPVNRG